MNQYIKGFTAVIFGLVLLSSCAKKLTETERVKLPKKKATELVNILDSISQIKPKYFYTKITTHVEDTNRNVNFKTSVRMTADSAMNALITYASIPIVNAMITTDSVIITNKREKCYIRQSLDYIKENFAIDFNFSNLEELILGMPLDFDSTQKYFMVHDPYNYIISSHKKRDFKKLERSDKEDVLIKYYLTDSLTGLKGMYIESPSDTASIKVDYLVRENIDGYDVPREVFIQIISARNNMRINMSYEKIEVDIPKEMILVIPDTYEQCK
ncbi:MAG: DUF4292 domain-containing protein [Bacteroidetes bacterium]|nr:MAG: DUF4292 domain-containing protein [Bacteroidota bacterium]